MGNFLTAPVTEKDTERGETRDDGLEFAVSSMQGWRVHMEDAHICQPYLFAQALTLTEQSDNATGETHMDVSSTSISHAENYNQECTSMSTVGSNNNNNKANDKDYQKINLPNHSLFAVFDGHGGNFAAEYASRNFCRVLSRQPAFLRYAKYFLSITNHIDIHNNSNNINSNDNTCETSTADIGATSTSANHTNTNTNTATIDLNDTSASNIDIMTPQQLAQYHRQGLAELEMALRDTFIDIDKEIIREVYGIDNPDSNTPYLHFPSTTHNYTHNNHHSPPPEPNPIEDAGTTATVVLLTPQYILCANAGDSRAIYSKNSHAVPLSYDHKPDDEIEERRIIDAGGVVRAGRVDGDLAVSRGLGDFRFKEPETVLQGSNLRYDLSGQQNADFKNNNHHHHHHHKKTDPHLDSTSMGKPTLLPEHQKVSPVPDIIVQKRNETLDEFVVVACDGIWDVQSNHDCVSLVKDIFKDGESDIGLICEEVLDTCLAKGSKDNMTVLIIKLPAQPITEGGGCGGVMERRRKREEAMELEDA